MQIRVSVLLSIAAVLVGVHALPAPQLVDTATVPGVGGLAAAAGGQASVTADKTTAAQAVTSVTAPTDTSVAQTTPKVVVVTSSEAPSTTPTPTTSAVVVVTPSTTSTPDTPTLAPTTSSTPVPVTTSSSELNAARVATANTQVTTTSDSSTPVPTVILTLTSSAPTPSSTTSSTASSTAVAQAQSSSSGGVNTKTILIVGGTVGGLVIAAFIAFSIFRKLKLKPSRSFEERMEPTVANGHLEEWNDPRTFRGYMQNSSSAQSLGRSNSQASSKYSFDAADEKAGNSANVMRGNTIRQFGAEKTGPMGGDGLREGGRGYRGF